MKVITCKITKSLESFLNIGRARLRINANSIDIDIYDISFIGLSSFEDIALRIQEKLTDILVIYTPPDLLIFTHKVNNSLISSSVHRANEKQHIVHYVLCSDIATYPTNRGLHPLLVAANYEDFLDAHQIPHLINDLGLSRVNLQFPFGTLNDPGIAIGYYPLPDRHIIYTSEMGPRQLELELPDVVSGFESAYSDLVDTVKLINGGQFIAFFGPPYTGFTTSNTDIGIGAPYLDWATEPLQAGMDIAIDSGNVDPTYPADPDTSPTIPYVTNLRENDTEVYIEQNDRTDFPELDFYHNGSCGGWAVQQRQELILQPNSIYFCAQSPRDNILQMNLDFSVERCKQDIKRGFEVLRSFATWSGITDEETQELMEYSGDTDLFSESYLIILGQQLIPSNNVCQFIFDKMSGSNKTRIIEFLKV